MLGDITDIWEIDPLSRSTKSASLLALSHHLAQAVAESPQPPPGLLKLGDERHGVLTAERLANLGAA